MNIKLSKKKYDDCYSWYKANEHKLRSEWGGFKDSDEIGENGEKQYLLYYSKYQQYIPINENGFFYNIFDCSKYDGVIQLKDGLYLTERNERYGIVNEKDEVILHTCYNSIEHITDVTDYNVFVVSSECGYFIFNQTLNIQSKIYEEIKSRKDGDFIVKENERYGLISATGELLIPTNYEYNNWGNNLYEVFKGYRYTIYVRNNLLYGKFPINSSIKYMLFSLGSHVGNKIIITYKDNKYGILWDNESHVVEDTILDDIIVRENKGLNSIFEWISFGDKNNKWYTTVFVIAAENGGYPPTQNGDIRSLF